MSAAVSVASTARTPRMKNVAWVAQPAMEALQAFGKAGLNLGVPEKTLGLIDVRASQINGCSVCLVMHHQQLRDSGESGERIAAIAGWRDAPFYTEAERAALALTEAVTRLADKEDPVSDEVWAAVARNYDENGQAALLIRIVTINAWNRLNVSTHQTAGQRWK